MAVKHLVSHVALFVEIADVRRRCAQHLRLRLALYQQTDSSAPYICTRSVKLVEHYQVVLVGDFRHVVYQPLIIAVSHTLVPCHHLLLLFKDEIVRSENQHHLKRLCHCRYNVRLARASGMHHARLVARLQCRNNLLIGYLIVLLQNSSHNLQIYSLSLVCYLKLGPFSQMRLVMLRRRSCTRRSGYRPS